MPCVMKKIYIIPSMDSAPMKSFPYMLPATGERRRGYAIDNFEHEDSKIIDIEEQIDDSEEYGWFIEID